MPSQVEICRLSLAHIADAARVNSITPPDSTIQAQHCATFYPIARDKCLAAYDWPFSKTRAPLAESLVALPNEEWAFVYALPADYIRAIKVLPPGAPRDFPGQDFILEHDSTENDVLLFTNVPEAVLHYVFRQEETGRYTPGFISALSYLLGSYLAGPILKGRVGMQVKQALYELYESDVRQASAEAANSEQTSDGYKNYKPAWVTDR